MVLMNLMILFHSRSLILLNFPDNKGSFSFRFEAIWKFRQHVWPHLESSAHILLKVRFLLHFD